MNKKKYYKANLPFNLKNNLIRILWNITYYLLFRFSPLYLSGYRRVILRLFGAKIDTKVKALNE